MEKKELISNYNIDLESLKREQLKFAHSINVKDSMDFSELKMIGAIQNITLKHKIISVIVLCNKEGEILEQQYFFDKLRFPYIYGFRAYRELPAMLSAFNKLNEKPDVVLISGHGIDHERLGLASHFSLSADVPCIGVANSLYEGNKIDKEGNILKKNIKVGKIIQTKENSNPIYVSPGNNISIETSVKICKDLVKEPHKLPEPLYLAYKYAREVKEELNL